MRCQIWHKGDNLTSTDFDHVPSVGDRIELYDYNNEFPSIDEEKDYEVVQRSFVRDTSSSYSTNFVRLYISEVTE